jgi:hypothetical protein
MKKRQVLPVVLTLVFILGACATAQESPDMAMAKEDDAMMEEEAMMEDEMAEESMSDEQGDEMGSDDHMLDEAMMAPAWFSVPLVDVHTGTSFTIDELKGQVVLVETMAVWCSNCLRQQREVQTLHAALGERDDFISIALDIDPNENAEILRNFAEGNGFDWLYAVAPVEVASQFGELYGQQFLNPPSTPILLIDRHGEVHTLPFGIKSAGELRESVESLLEQM